MKIHHHAEEKYSKTTGGAAHLHPTALIHIFNKVLFLLF